MTGDELETKNIISSLQEWKEDELNIVLFWFRGLRCCFRKIFTSDENDPIWEKGVFFEKDKIHRGYNIAFSQWKR
jgi:hypothetical protein